MLTKLAIERKAAFSELLRAMEEECEEFFKELVSISGPEVAVRFQISRKIATWADAQVYWQVRTPIYWPLEDRVCRAVSWRLKDELLRVWKVRDEDLDDEIDDMEE